ncbi:RIP metalloprotease [Paraconexibacter sp.]|uniref:M50 family metallopeptidase n=1 Tax=Paraconexibacter sp. TaxID=2949640 RepID=UPI0035659119
MSWLIAFAGFAALIVLHEFGHFAAAKAVGMRVERFALFFPPLLFTVKRGETEYGVGAVPLGGYVRITGMNPAEEIPPEHAHRAYYRQPVWKRVIVISAGPLMNVLIAFLILWALFLSQGVQEPSTRVEAVEKGSVAQGQLLPGDRIVSVDGRTGDLEVLSRQIASHRCAGEQVAGCAAAEPATVVLDRDGRRLTLELTPRFDAQATPPRTRLGFAFGADEVDVGPIDAADRSVAGMWRVTTGTVDAITRLFYDSAARKEVSGVVGSYEVTRQSVEVSWIQAMQILAIISLSLAIVNLFPFLPLDGGHIFWALAEKIRRRPIPFSVMERASVVGFLLVIFIFAVGLTNDIDRLRGEGFGIR